MGYFGWWISADLAYGCRLPKKHRFFPILAGILVAIFYILVVLLIVVTIIGIATILRIRSNQALFEQDVEYSFEKEKITSRTAKSYSEFSWDMIKKVKQTNKIFVLQLVSVRPIVSFIPKRAFFSQNDLDEFVSLLQEKKLL